MSEGLPPSYGIGRIVEELRDLRARGATGTYYIVSDDNRQGRIGWSAGEIDSVVFRGVDGVPALAALAQVRALRTRFGPEVSRGDPAGRSGLPGTDELLRLLGGSAPEPRAPAPERSRLSDGRAVRLSMAAHKTISDTLTDYLGPVAALIYMEHQERQRTVEALLEALAAEIPDSRRAQAFLDEIRRKLKRRG